MPITLIQILRRIEAEKEKEKEYNTMKEHEMTAREYAHQRARMCKGRSCWECPLFDAARRNSPKSSCTDLQLVYPDEAVRLVEKWAAEHPEPKPSVLVPDEMTNVYTYQATYIDKAGYEFSEKQKRDRRRFMEELLRGALPNADDFKCVSFQQFVTKAHEQSEEEREDAGKWRE